MQLEQNQRYRKTATPRSNAAGVLLAGIMVAVCLFGIAGIRVAALQLEFYRFVWVPVLLTSMSGVALIFIILRFVRKKNRRY